MLIVGERICAMKASYRDRIADRELQRKLSWSGAVLIEGPKACGKTATATQIARTIHRLDTDENARTAIQAAPDYLFSQPPPILFDEWQVAPEIWNRVRRAVDDRAPERGAFILTGSATPADDVTRHSGAGRVATLRMRPMSLSESGHSTGQVSLEALFEDAASPALDPGLTVPEIIDLIVIGGWPRLLGATARDGSEWVREYINQIIEVDVPSLGSRRDPVNVRRLLASLGRSVGTDMSVTSLAKDVGGPNGPLSRNTIDAYLGVLSRLMLVEDVPAWGPHMRSATPLRATATRYLVDPSIGVAALGVGPSELLSDLNATGFHFEALVVRDLRVYAQPLGGRLHHWRDNNGHEVDIVITLDDGRWGAFEVKMNPRDADAAAASLLRFAAKVDTTRVGEPAVLGVITTTGVAHRRDDGVHLVPIGHLGP
jgi:predicted AAA+ superfamily ATPase